MKPDLAKLALPIGLLGLNVAISLAFLLGGKLSDPAPAGFWVDGTVLSEAPAWVVAFRLPFITAVLILAIMAALRWDPRFAQDERRRGGAFGPITHAFLALTCLGNYNFLTAAAAGGFVMTPFHVMLTGLWLLAAGNFVAKSASNGFWGLHNRWTRTHEAVARLTNRLLGILWMVEGGAVVLASPLIVKVGTMPVPDAGQYVAMGLLPFVLLTAFPIGIAVLASYRYAKQTSRRPSGQAMGG